MRKITLLTALLVAIAACGGSDDGLNLAEEEIAEQLIEAAADQDVQLDLEADPDEDGAFTVKIDEDDGSGQVSFGGGLPDDFPFPLPDEYEVGTSMEFEQDGGTSYSAVIHTGPDEFDALASMYESWLNDQGFEVSKTELVSDDKKVTFLMGQREDAAADISLALDDVANDDAGNLIYETNISMTWAPR